MNENGGTNVRSFSLRRILQQRIHFSRNSRSSRNTNRNDIETGISPSSKIAESLEKAEDESRFQPHCSITLRNKENIFCAICYSVESLSNVFSLQICNHQFCLSCLENYLKHEISESRINITCPQCSSGIHPNNIAVLLSKFPEYKNKYEDFMLRKYLVTDPDSRWCPAPDCGFALIASGCASCPQLLCQKPDCGLSFCYHCKEEWHPDQTCDDARISRKKISYSSSSCKNYESLCTDDVKPCPKCQVYIVKMNDGSCNHMVCSLCGTEFCWLCMREVSDLHYLSPSGCTFWGKKPWSKRKKILWQIGTLIGAPVGIALLAGIAIPSIVIGMPVWVGRKLMDRYKTSNKQKKMFSVGLGIFASIILAPLFAGLAIAVGIPLLLFYVYGIVPISLFRATYGSHTKKMYKCNNTQSHNQTLDSGKSSIFEADHSKEVDAFYPGDTSSSISSKSRHDSPQVLME